MQIKVTGDGEGFGLQFSIRWLALQGFLKALLTTVIVVAGLLSSPAAAQLRALLGW